MANLQCIVFNKIMVFFFTSLLQGVPEKIDPASLPVTESVSSWMWLIDLERALALLVGQTLGSMLAGPGVSHEEKECEKWLSSPLLWNGLEDRDPERGTWFF